MEYFGSDSNPIFPPPGVNLCSESLCKNLPLDFLLQPVLPLMAPPAGGLPIPLYPAIIVRLPWLRDAYECLCRACRKPNLQAVGAGLVTVGVAYWAWRMSLRWWGALYALDTSTIIEDVGLPDTASLDHEVEKIMSCHVTPDPSQMTFSCSSWTGNREQVNSEATSCDVIRSSRDGCCSCVELGAPLRQLQSRVDQVMTRVEEVLTGLKALDRNGRDPDTQAKVNTRPLEKTGLDQPVNCQVKVKHLVGEKAKVNDSPRLSGQRSQNGYGNVSLTCDVTSLKQQPGARAVKSSVGGGGAVWRGAQGSLSDIQQLIWSMEARLDRIQAPVATPAVDSLLSRPVPSLTSVGSDKWDKSSSVIILSHETPNTLPDTSLHHATDTFKDVSLCQASYTLPDTSLRKMSKDSPFRNVTQDTSLRNTSKDSPFRNVTQDASLRHGDRIRHRVQGSPFRTMRQEASLRNTKQDALLRIKTQDTSLRDVTKHDAPLRDVTKHDALLCDVHNVGPLRTAEQSAPMRFLTRDACLGPLQKETSRLSAALHLVEDASLRPRNQGEAVFRYTVPESASLRSLTQGATTHQDPHTASLRSKRLALSTESPPLSECFQSLADRTKSSPSRNPKRNVRSRLQATSAFPAIREDLLAGVRGDLALQDKPEGDFKSSMHQQLLSPDRSPFNRLVGGRQMSGEGVVDLQHHLWTNSAHSLVGSLDLPKVNISGSSSRFRRSEMSSFQNLDTSFSVMSHRLCSPSTTSVRSVTSHRSRATPPTHSETPGDSCRGPWSELRALPPAPRAHTRGGMSASLRANGEGRNPAPSPVYRVEKVTLPRAGAAMCVSTDTELRRGDGISTTSDTRKDDWISTVPETHRGDGVSTVPETPRGDGIRISTMSETRRGDRISTVPEPRKGDGISTVPETPRGDGISTVPETPRGDGISTMSETRRGDGISTAPETRRDEGAIVSVGLEGLRDEGVSTASETLKDDGIVSTVPRVSEGEEISTAQETHSGKGLSTVLNISTEAPSESTEAPSISTEALGVSTKAQEAILAVVTDSTRSETTVQSQTTTSTAPPPPPAEFKGTAGPQAVPEDWVTSREPPAPRHEAEAQTPGSETTPSGQGPQQGATRVQSDPSLDHVTCQPCRKLSGKMEKLDMATPFRKVFRRRNNEFQVKFVSKSRLGGEGQAATFDPESRDEEREEEWIVIVPTED